MVNIGRSSLSAARLNFNSQQRRSGIAKALLGRPRPGRRGTGVPGPGSTKFMGCEGSLHSQSECKVSAHTGYHKDYRPRLGRTPGAEMAAYLIGFLRVKDWDWYREYRAASEPLVAKHEGRYLVKGGPLTWAEGDPPPPDAVVVIEFPSRAHAEQFYADPNYAPMISLRLEHSSPATELLIVNGI